MNRYPKAKTIMKSRVLPFRNEVKMVDEYLDGRDDYPEGAERLGLASDELCRLADFLKFFLASRKKQTKVYFGEKAYGNAYIHGHDHIHIQTPNLLIGLHEVGHALYGESELDACVFSTGLMLASKRMRKQTPIFNGHRLIN